MILKDMMYVTRLEITTKGGGVAWYVNKELASKYIPHKSIVVDHLHKNVIVSCLYRTPGSNINDFSEIIYDLYSELSVSIFFCMWRF